MITDALLGSPPSPTSKRAGLPSLTANCAASVLELELDALLVELLLEELLLEDDALEVVEELALDTLEELLTELLTLRLELLELKLELTLELLRLELLESELPPLPHPVSTATTMLATTTAFMRSTRSE